MPASAVVEPEHDVQRRLLESVRIGGDLGVRVGDHWWFAPVLWSRGKLRLAQGRTQEGLEDLLEFGRRGERDDLGGSLGHAWASLAAPWLHQRGEEAEARRIAQEELDQAHAWGTPRAVGQALRALGLITPGADGCRLLCAAVETLETSPARLEHGRALIDLGAALRRRNQRVAAREPLRAGLDIASRCGAGLLVERGTHELRATGAKPRRLTLAGVEALTASERRIAEMAAEGQTNRQIAQALFVTIKTVETHMAHVFQKLDVRSRHEVRPRLAAAATYVGP
jgi:DNA-binding CsgD family transcriptional regulator